MKAENSASSPRVVLLNGPAGVGKTTVGRRLAATALNGVCIHGDDLKHFIVSRKPGAVQLGLSYAGGAALADVYLGAGYDLVVFEFIFENAANVARFQDALQADVAVHLVTLWATLATVARREGTRVGRERLGDRVATCWAELSEHLDELGAVVDAEEPTGEVLVAVQDRLADGSAQLR